MLDIERHHAAQRLHQLHVSLWLLVTSLSLFLWLIDLAIHTAQRNGNQLKGTISIYTQC
jgi:hypothetical protein